MQDATSQPEVPDASDSGVSTWTDSLLWFYLTLAVGLGATAALFVHYVAVDQDHAHAQLQRGVDSLASFTTSPVAIDPIQKMFSSVIAAQTELQRGAELSADLLRRHLPPDPGALGYDAVSLGYLARVTPATLDQYRARLANEESAGLPIVELAADSTVVPAGVREEYFPLLIGVASAAEFQPMTGLDRSSDAMHRLAMLQARDSAYPVVLTTFPVETTSRDPLVVRFYLPVYDSSTTPATLEERRAQFTGLLSAVSYQNSQDLFMLLSPTLQGIQAAYFPESDLPQSDPDYAELRALIANRDVVTTPYTINGQGFVLAGRAGPLLAQTLATSTRWWVLCIGLLLTSWFASMALWFRNQSKRIKALVSARTRDLSDRTAALGAANKALRDSESRYRMLADNATDVIYTCDLEGRYTYVSPSVELQRGFKPEELLGRPLGDQLPMHEQSTLRERYLQAQTLTRENPGQQVQLLGGKVEFQGYCKDGSLKWLETTASLLFDATGRWIGLLGVSRDVSERKRAELEREQLEEAWRQAQKMEAIGTLAGGIAHDFNNLLTSIYGYSDILREQVGINPEAHRSIDIIEKTAVRAKELTSQLLGFARKGGMEIVIVDINESILEVISLLARTINKNIAIQHHPSAVKPTVRGDSGQLVHLLLNLGINARDAMPDGGTLTYGVNITELDAQYCRVHTEVTPGTYCHITVADTGIGMDKAKMARIFEPFFTDKDRGKGTGLGLAMVYGVARSHGGIVTVESELGRGSTFHVFLPYSQSL